MDEIGIRFREAVDHHRAGRLQDASTAYQRVLALDPRHAASLHLLGSIALQLGRSDLAANLIEAAIGIDGEVAAFHNDLGEAYRAQGRNGDAALAFARALDLAPDLASATNNLAILMQGERQYETAIRLYHRAVELMPDSADLRMNLGCALLESGDVAGGAETLGAAHRMAPDDPVVALNLGNARMAEDRPDEAAALYRSALSRKPDYALAEVNLGRALRDLGQPAEALRHYQAAVALAPDLATARWNEGSCRLLLGDFPGGWQGFAERWRAGAVPPHGLAAPEWDGSPLGGRRLLIHAEQGLGDTLQFVRFLKLLGAGEITLLCQPPLVRLLTASGFRVAGPDDLPAHDVRLPLMDLPRLLGTTVDTIPAAVPYLTVDEDVRSRWRERLGTGTGRRVGLVWQGRPDHANDRNRSLAPALLAPLLSVPGIDWFSLQKDAGPLRGAADLAPMVTDMTETAGAVLALDLVITVDTSVAHLAGALGQPVWILLPFAPDWRWLAGRDDSPWYPTARLFRQTARGDWPGVIERVRASLGRWHEIAPTYPVVMAGPDPAIHVMPSRKPSRKRSKRRRVDGRIKSGHDGLT